MDFQTYFELNQLYARYARALDAADWEAWPEFFIDHCVYKLQPRENHERGFPLATLAFADQADSILQEVVQQLDARAAKAGLTV